MIYFRADHPVCRRMGWQMQWILQQQRQGTMQSGMPRTAFPDSLAACNATVGEPSFMHQIWAVWLVLAVIWAMWFRMSAAVRVGFSHWGVWPVPS